MLNSDRIFGVVVFVVALAYLASATQIETSFLSDPVGPKIFPIIIASVALVCSGMFFIRPDGNPQWPDHWTFLRIGLALVILIGYAMTLRPLGFIVPTALAAGLLSYQIHSNKKTAALTGLGLSLGLFFLFKYALGLGLFPWPRTFIG